MSYSFFEADDGAKLAYRDTGSGLPTLALAGLSRDGHDFDYVAQHLRHIRMIRLDCRGRGASQWSGASTYTVAREARDIILLLDHLGLEKACVIGVSRGGLVGMFLAETHKDRLLGLCLVDVGPVLERAGLLRIGTYLGIRPSLRTLNEIAERMPMVMSGFRNVPETRWAEEAIRHFVQRDGFVDLPYDPDLRRAFDSSMQAPMPNLWAWFDSCAGFPLALIRGANSDVLSAYTAIEMRRRRPDLLFAEVLDRGHVPFLDEPEALSLILKWLEIVQCQRDARAS